MVNSSLVRLLLLVDYNLHTQKKFCGMFKTSSLLDYSSPYLCTDWEWLDRSPHSFSKIVILKNTAKESKESKCNDQRTSFAVIASPKTITVHDQSSVKAISLVESAVTCISSAICSAVKFGIHRYDTPVSVIAAGKRRDVEK